MFLAFQDSSIGDLSLVKSVSEWVCEWLSETYFNFSSTMTAMTTMTSLTTMTAITTKTTETAIKIESNLVN